jgi:hypothetical protein
MIEKGNRHWIDIRFKGIDSKHKKHIQKADLGITTTIDD